MTRTEALIHELTERLRERHQEIDRGVRTVTLIARYSPDCLEPRELTDLIERERRPQSERKRA